MDPTDSIARALTIAIRMEEAGMAYYRKCAAMASSDLGARVFQGLAEDEKVHLATFKGLLADTLGQEALSELKSLSRSQKELPLFPKDLKAIEGASANADEVSALNQAIEAEKLAVDFYTEMLKHTKEELARSVIEEIIGQEQHHFLLLTNELDYLLRTGEWYESAPMDL